MSRFLQRWARSVVVQRQEAADVGHAVLLGAHRAAVGVAEHLLGDRQRRLIGVALFAQLDEPGVLGEAAGIEEEGDAVAMAQIAGPRGYWPCSRADRRRSCW